MALSPSMDRIGTRIGGRYELVRLIAEGGMGSVYEALDLQYRRRVAVKLLKPELTSDADAVERFVLEARAAASIDHPSVIQILDQSRTDDGAPYIVMAYLEGESLADRLYRSGRLDEATATLLVMPVVSALERAHAHGIVHRDLKPENIFLATSPGQPDRPVLVDFGVSKVGSAGSPSVDRAGAVLGTPSYMSPEQAAGRGDVDARSDIYSMGALMYELVSGVVPFQRDRDEATLAAIQHETARPLSGIIPTISPSLEAVIACAMARDAISRFQSMALLGGALEEARRAPATGGPILQAHAMARDVLARRAAEPMAGSEPGQGAELADDSVHTLMVMPTAAMMAGLAGPPPAALPGQRNVVPPPRRAARAPQAPIHGVPDNERLGLFVGLSLAMVGVLAVVIALVHHGSARNPDSRTSPRAAADREIPRAVAVPSSIIPARDAGTPAEPPTFDGGIVPTRAELRSHSTTRTRHPNRAPSRHRQGR